jgi:hypothetical protein
MDFDAVARAAVEAGGTFAIEGTHALIEATSAGY